MSLSYKMNMHEPNTKLKEAKIATTAEIPCERLPDSIPFLKPQLTDLVTS